MTIYSDSRYPIRDAIGQAHENTLRSFTTPGRWFDAAERAAIVNEARAARAEVGLQESGANDNTPSGATLSATTKHVARTVATGTQKLDRSFFEDALAAGMSDNEYVETVGVVARLLSVDVFCRGIGVETRALPTLDAGEPSHKRPETAINEKAWTDTVPGGRRGGSDAIDIYGTDKPEGAPFIYRALSLVPEEAKGLIALGAAQYLDIENFMDLDFSYEPNMTRAQVEVVAGRVSAINECFY